MGTMSVNKDFLVLRKPFLVSVSEFTIGLPKSLTHRPSTCKGSNNDDGHIHLAQLQIPVY